MQVIDIYIAIVWLVVIVVDADAVATVVAPRQAVVAKRYKEIACLLKGAVQAKRAVIEDFGIW